MEMQLPKQVREALEILDGAGYEAGVVGGAVRDHLLGRPVSDYDLAVSALPGEVTALFEEAGYRVIPTGERHGTVTVIADGMPLEITSCRTEGDYTDHRRPDQVRFGVSLEEDLGRRDFTVNAMAYHPGRGLLDPFGGAEDLRAGILRCVGDPGQRFSEDALRILRALRFSARLGFVPEEETKRSLLELKEQLTYVAAERIREEMDKLLTGPYAAEVLEEYGDVFGVFIPELLPCMGFAQHTEYHAYDVYGHMAHAVGEARLSPETLAVYEEAGLDTEEAFRELRWAALLHDIEKPACFFLGEDGNGHFYGHSEKSAETADAVLQRLKFDTAGREKIVFLVRHHDRQFVLEERPVKRALRKFGKTDLLLLMDLYTADCLAQSELAKPRVIGHQIMRILIEHLTKEKGTAFSRKDLAVTGHDVAALGYQGPEIGEALELLLTGVIEEEVENDREALLAFLEERRKS